MCGFVWLVDQIQEGVTDKCPTSCPLEIFTGMPGVQVSSTPVLILLHLYST